jgi:predicted nucleic acid-binding protein
MRVLFDTDVIFDLLLDREPFAAPAAELWQANVNGHLKGFVSAITPVNIFYIARRLKGRQAAFQAVTEVLAALSVSPLDQQALQIALTLPFTDYEDAVQHACATGSQLDAIVTRNVKDFSGATLPILSPTELLQQLPPASQPDA